MNTRHRYMRSTLFLVGMMGMMQLLPAQGLWNKTYVEDRPAMLFSGVHSVEDGFLMSGMAIDTTSPQFANAMILRINNNGSTQSISEKKSSLEYGVFYNNLIETKQGKFAFTGYVIDTVPTPFLAVYDTLIDTILLVKYSTPNTYVYLGNALLQGDDNNYYVAGIKTDSSTGNGNVSLIKIDSSGNRIWEKFFNQRRLDVAQSIIQLANSNLLIGAMRNDLNTTNEHANTWLLEVDTGGNIVRQWFDPNDSTYVAEGLRQTQDGGFIYGAQKKNYQSGPSSVSYIATIVKLDSNFNKQWTYKGGFKSIYTGISDIEELEDGSFIACGHYPIYGTDTALWGCIIKLNANGTVIWEKTYRGINASQSLNFLSDIDVLPDGGFIAVGQCQLSGATPPQVGWFLKLDSNGCEIENCLVGIDARQEILDNRQLQVFPNPANNTVQLSLSHTMLGAAIKLYDLSGKVVLEQTAISESLGLDISSLQKGMYVVAAQHQGQQARAKLVVE